MKKVEMEEWADTRLLKEVHKYWKFDTSAWFFARIENYSNLI